MDTANMWRRAAVSAANGNFLFLSANNFFLGKVCAVTLLFTALQLSAGAQRPENKVLVTKFNNTDVCSLSAWNSWHDQCRRFWVNHTCSNSSWVKSREEMEQCSAIKDAFARQQMCKKSCDKKMKLTQILHIICIFTICCILTYMLGILWHMGELFRYKKCIIEIKVPKMEKDQMIVPLPDNPDWYTVM